MRLHGYNYRLYATGCLLALTLLVPENLSASDNILSKDRLEIFNLGKQKVIEESAKLEKDWINAVIYKYSQNYTETYDTAKSVISINQPIFKSGGIYKAIKYANAVKKYSNLDIQSQKKALIKDATNLLFSIYKTELTIKKQKLLIANAKLDIDRKKEQVLNGILDTSFLDNAILDANIKKNQLLDLKFQKQSLINSFNNLSSAPYTSFELPTLKLIEKEEFEKNNLAILKSRADIDSKHWYSGMSVAKYLPAVNLTYDYTKYHDRGGNPFLTDDNVQSYGFNITIPLDVRTFNDIQSSKIEYLKAKTALQNNIVSEQNIFKTTLSKIHMLDEKVKIAKDDLQLYDSLLAQMVELKEVGIKTQSDVDTLQNSKSIKAIDIDIYDMDKQIELLEIYARVTNEI